MTKVINNVESIEAIDHIQKCNLPCLLLGETGTGKTTLVKALAEKYGKTLTRINLNGQTGREELLGKYVLIGGETKRQDWPLTTALKHGHWILLDEINAALPEVLFTIQALTESVDNKLGNILLAEKDGEVIVTHQECRIFGTANPSDKYVWTKAFNPATLSRFVVIEVLTLTAEDEMVLLKERYPKVKEEDLIKVIKVWQELRQANSEEKIEFFCSTRELVNTVALIDSGLSWARAVVIGILNKVQDRFERDDVRTIINKSLKLTKANAIQFRSEYVSAKAEVDRLQRENDRLETDNANFQAIAKQATDDLAVAQEQIMRADDVIKTFGEAQALFQSMKTWS